MVIRSGRCVLPPSSHSDRSLANLVRVEPIKTVNLPWDRLHRMTDREALPVQIWKATCCTCCCSDGLMCPVQWQNLNSVTRQDAVTTLRFKVALTSVETYFSVLLSCNLGTLRMWPIRHVFLLDLWPSSAPTCVCHSALCQFLFFCFFFFLIVFRSGFVGPTGFCSIHLCPKVLQSAPFWQCPLKSENEVQKCDLVQHAGFFFNSSGHRPIENPSKGRRIKESLCATPCLN